MHFLNTMQTNIKDETPVSLKRRPGTVQPDEWPHSDSYCDAKCANQAI